MRNRLIPAVAVACTFLGLSFLTACAPADSDAETTAIIDTLPTPGTDAEVSSTPNQSEEDVRAGRVGDTCGTRGTGPCAKNLYCKFDRTANCGRSDAGGVCAKKPRICSTIYAPVCGCDGKTYSSECVANGSGVSADYDGACK